MKIFLVCTLFVSLIGCSNQQCLTTNDQERNSMGQKIFYSGQQEFSLALLKAINEGSPRENIFFSPYSTYRALLLAYFISGGKTESYLKTALKLDTSLSKSSIFSAYHLDKLLNRYRAQNTSYEFITVNRIYITNQVVIRSCLQVLFEDELQIGNFQQYPNEFRNEINRWVEYTTHAMIKNLLPPETIDGLTNSVLINAAYFKGVWENKFDPRDTKPEAFFVSPTEQPTMVDMMHLETTLNFTVSKTLKAHVLELPYQGDISMYILLPPFSLVNSIETAVKSLNLENFKTIINGSLSPRQVHVSLPKFILEHTIEPILEYLGIGNLFQHDANFFDLTSRFPHELSVSAGIHKAKIEINEEGSEAAAATSLLQNEKDMIVEFKCNRPFVFVLYSKVLRNILFAGVYRKPVVSH